MDKKKKWIIFLAGILLIWAVVFFNSSPLSQKGEISLENFIYCKIQTIEVKNQTGYVYGVDIREIEPVEKLVEDIEELKIRKALPWEKLHSVEEYPYTMELRYDSEEAGRYESIHFWENGEIVFRGDSYMIADRNKTQMTDRLEWLLRNYETEE